MTISRHVNVILLFIISGVFINLCSPNFMIGLKSFILVFIERDLIFFNQFIFYFHFISGFP